MNLHVINSFKNADEFHECQLQSCKLGFAKILSNPNEDLIGKKLNSDE